MKFYVFYTHLLILSLDGELEYLKALCVFFSFCMEKEKASKTYKNHIMNFNVSNDRIFIILMLNWLSWNWYYYLPIRMAKNNLKKKLIVLIAGEDAEQQEFLFVADVNVKWYSYF